MEHHYLILIGLFAVLLLARAHDTGIPPTISGSPLEYGGTMAYYETDQEMTLKCDAKGSPEPKIDWFKDGKRLDVNAYNIEKVNNNLLIFQMTSLDEGSYHCVARNTNGKAMSISVELVKSRLGRYPPSAVQTYEADEGDFLMIPCQEVKSIPSAIYSWAVVESMDDWRSKSLKDIGSERLTISPQGYLYFAHVEPADEYGGQLYTCNVFNPELDISVGGSYARVIVNRVSNVANKPPALQYPPSNENAPVIAVLGEHFELKCIFSGKPAPHVSWRKVGGFLPRSRFDSDQEEGTILQNIDIQWDDEGDYVCTGDNEIGTKSYTIHVDVQSKPAFIDPAKAPDHVFRNLNVTEGSKAEFYCEADPLTEPAPEITFLINANPLDDEFPGPRRTIKKLESGHGKVLSIDNVCKDCVSIGTDLMGIQCKIENVHGVVFRSVYLNVLC